MIKYATLHVTYVVQKPKHWDYSFSVENVLLPSYEPFYSDC